MRTTRGFTLVEVVVAASVLSTALLGLFAVLTSSVQLDTVAVERAAALKAARDQIAWLERLPVLDAFATPTSRAFTVSFVAPSGKLTMLKPQGDDPDRVVGFIWFPGDDATVVSADEKRLASAGRALTLPRAGTAGQLREDVVFSPLGLPRDLNASGAIDATDVSTTAVLVPVVVGVEWQGVAGRMSLRLETTLGPR